MNAPSAQPTITVGGFSIDILVQGFPGKTVCHGGLGWSTVALVRGQGRVILMDEPTAALGVRESRKVLDLIRHLKSTGVGVVVISHNLRHVFTVADRILVMRRGRVAGLREQQATTPDEIVRLIVGVDTL